MAGAGDWGAMAFRMPGACVCRSRRRPSCRIIRDFGTMLAAPATANRRAAWKFDLSTYERRNGNERPFRTLQGNQRIFTRLEKLDVIFFALVVAIITRMQAAFLSVDEQGAAKFFNRQCSIQSKICTFISGIVGLKLLRVSLRSLGFSSREIGLQFPQ